MGSCDDDSHAYKTKVVIVTETIDLSVVMHELETSLETPRSTLARASPNETCAGHLCGSRRVRALIINTCLTGQSGMLFRRARVRQP
jgi:hypothetical protein